MKTRAADGRWETKFAVWVTEYGVEKLAQDLECTPSAIYFWLRITGRKVYPDPERAIRMTELAAGYLTLEDIFLHRRQALAIAGRPN